MLVLAIDTALAACSAAVLDGARGVIGCESVAMARGQAEVLMPMVARVMDEAGADFRALDRIVVTVGPGSFTGLRVGISAARGIALACSKPAIGVTTLAAFAAPHLAANASAAVMAVIDARHRQVYMQVFGPDGKSVAAPRLATLDDAVVAAGAGPLRLVGSGAELVVSAWPATMPAPMTVDQRQAPDIGWVARLGAAAAESDASPKPLYLRAPDARPQNAALLPRRA